MALEAVVFPQDIFSYSSKDLYSLAAALSYDFKIEEDEEEEKVDVLECEVSAPLDTNQQQLGLGLDGLHVNWDSSSALLHNINEWGANSSPEEACTADGFFTGSLPTAEAATVVASGRRKRRRTKSCKNKEEVENQRMTHIAVERNRRKQMNEYLAVLRSLMPSSYIQRGDQASIIGGAINFVKELEQLLQSLEAQKRITQRSDANFTSPFADFFTFPQYSSCSNNCNSTNETVAENRSAIADIEVTMVESHANLKVLSKRRPKQLLKIVAGLQNLHLTILHLNVTTIDQMVLYSLSVKVEDNCGLNSVDEIATAVYQMLGRIQEEAGLN
ncbi:transcription factor bHLH94-like [Magnolia sinica]|uniref:transcription factor bHLH94-like n=1 Tax=Magnolia sinica TaxID=86752 RepID=UPI002658859B|nr:transcription factor bHLH94-like [Magnolia sinica]